MALTNGELQFFEHLLRAEAGLELAKWIVEARVASRLQSTHLTIERYIELLGSRDGRGEVDALIEAVRVGETRFFRHRGQFDAVRDVVIPAWKVRGLARPAIWSAGCATGEEAYSLALLLAKEMPAPQFRPEIIGTDVSREAVQRAARGRYPASALDHIPNDLRGAIEVDEAPRGEELSIPAQVRELVSFREENLATATFTRRADLVWCRNVLIYFEGEARTRVLQKLVGALNPGGFLFVGYSESLREVVGLRAMAWQGHTLWERPDGASITRRSSTSEVARALPVRRAEPSRPGANASAQTIASGTTPGEPNVEPRGAVVVAITRSSADDMAKLLRDALGERAASELTLDFDAAPFIDDDVAPLLRRAKATAQSKGVRLAFRATRVGPRRWLKRHGLGDES